MAATQVHGSQTMVLNGPQPVEVHAARISFNFLPTFGIQPLLGRNFTPTEELPNGPKAVLLSNQLWRNRFDAKPDIVGKELLLDGQQYTVAGVLPASFIFPMDVAIDVLTTLPVSPNTSHHDVSMMTWGVYGRLKEGVTMTEARADLELLFGRSKADIPRMFRSDTSLVLDPLQEHRVGNAQLLLSILIGAVACLLMIACVNVSNLLLGRWSARSGELAVRAAIGAGCGRLARQLFTEAAFLTLISCFLSAILVTVTLRGFVHYAAGELPRLSEVTTDFRVFGIGVLLAAFTTLIFGGLPALRIGRIDIQRVLQQSGRLGVAAGYRLARRILVVAEIALSLILLAGAALLVQTLWHLRNDRLGFQPEHVLTITIPLKGSRLENRNSNSLADALISFARRLPGTEDVAQTECTPLSGGTMNITFSRSDRPLPEAFHRGDGIHVCGTGPGYARASGLRVVRGRFFTEDDSLHPNTLAVINEAAARAYFAGENPIGKQIIGGPQHQWKTVVGVVSNTKNSGLDAEPQPQALLNGVTDPSAPQLQLIMRSVSDQTALTSAIAQQVRTLDQGLLLNFQSLDETIGDLTAGPRFNGILLASFAAIAVLMAVIGIYGLLTFTVVQRSTEIGIRMALGAERLRILRLILQEGLILVLLGITVGLLSAFALTRYLKSILYGVTATDPWTFLIVAAGLLAFSLLAMSIPARKAASVDPVTALRHI